MRLTALPPPPPTPMTLMRAPRTDFIVKLDADFFRLRVLCWLVISFIGFNSLLADISI